jgi:GTP cyclohydrolase II
MTAKIIETNIPQANLPLVYNIVSSGAMELSYKDKISIGRLFHIQVNDEWRDYYVLYIGLLDQNKMPNLAENNDKEIIVRIDSGCLTGMVFGDRTCDCHEQLSIAIDSAIENGIGFIIHIPSQDGRGMGIDFKLKTLDEQYYNHLNTVESAKKVSHLENIDRRTYHGAVGCLKFLGVKLNMRLNIATNNPEKIEAFKLAGFTNLNTSRVFATHISDEVKKHLSAKQQFLGHLK